MAECATRFVALIFACFVITESASAAESPFANWAAVVVAGDHADSEGRSTEGFDNARRDVARNLLRLGFSPANLAQFSTRPRAYRRETLHVTKPLAIKQTLAKLAGRAPGGCFLYITSHGEEDGLVVGNWIVPPRALARIVDDACSARPTVVILSACFSGVMLPALEGPNRLILTAARRDRTSFGCGQSDRYPYFDQCVLESWDRASGFADLADRARACVAHRERAEHLRPHSDPQYFVGDQALSSLPRWR